MYVIYNEKEGFIYENQIGSLGYDFQLNENTKTFPNIEKAMDSCKMGEVVLRAEFHTTC